MEVEFSGKEKTRQALTSSQLMDVVNVDSSSDEEKGTKIGKAGTGSSASEDGEIDEHENEANQLEQQTFAAGERAQMDAAICADLAAGGEEVAQKDARYFMLEDVVCSHCGVKGHLSFDCPEEEQKPNCHICGKPGHLSRSCPDEMCYYCGKPGHRSRECPERAAGRGRKRRQLRSVSPPREPKLQCYVCGGDGHLDCGLAKMPTAILSCYNCGMTGHAGGGCHMTGADRVIPIVMEMERERKQKGMSKTSRGSRESGKGGNGNGKGGGGSDSNGKGGKGDESSSQADTPKAYREQILERARKSRYGRGNR